jgi:hypothetical protein
MTDKHSFSLRLLLINFEHSVIWLLHTNAHNRKTLNFCVSTAFEPLVNWLTSMRTSMTNKRKQQQQQQQQQHRNSNKLGGDGNAGR